MLRPLADAGAQVRRALRRATDAEALAAVAADGRPRAVVVAGIGGSGVAGDAARRRAPAPAARCRCSPLHGYDAAGLGRPARPRRRRVLLRRSARRPLAVADRGGQARLPPRRRSGARAPRCTEIVRQGRAVHVPRRRLARSAADHPVGAGRTALLVIADALGVVPGERRRARAPRPTRWTTVAEQCAPGVASPSSTRPSRWPWTWPARCRWSGAPRPAGGVAAGGRASQPAQRQRHPAVSGIAARGRRTTRSSPLRRAVRAAARRPSVDDIFRRPRSSDERPGHALRLVLLRDPDEHPQDVPRRRRGARTPPSRQRGVRVTELPRPARPRWSASPSSSRWPTTPASTWPSRPGSTRPRSWPIRRAAKDRDRDEHRRAGRRRWSRRSPPTSASPSSKFVAFAGHRVVLDAGRGVHSVADSGNQVLLLVGGPVAAAGRRASTRSATAGAVRLRVRRVDRAVLPSAGSSPCTRAAQDPPTRSRSRAPVVAFVVLRVAIVLESFSLPHRDPGGEPSARQPKWLARFVRAAQGSPSCPSSCSRTPARWSAWCSRSLGVALAVAHRRRPLGRCRLAGRSACCSCVIAVFLARGDEQPADRRARAARGGRGDPRRAGGRPPRSPG